MNLVIIPVPVMPLYSPYVDHKLEIEKSWRHSNSSFYKRKVRALADKRAQAGMIAVCHGSGEGKGEFDSTEGGLIYMETAWGPNPT